MFHWQNPLMMRKKRDCRRKDLIFFSSKANCKNSLCYLYPYFHFEWYYVHINFILFCSRGFWNKVNWQGRITFPIQTAKYAVIIDLSVNSNYLWQLLATVSRQHIQLSSHRAWLVEVIFCSDTEDINCEQYFYVMCIHYIPYDWYHWITALSRSDCCNVSRMLL